MDNRSHNLIGQLKNVLLKQRILFFVSGLLLTITVVSLGVIALSFIATVIVLSVPLKITLLSLLGIATLFVFYSTAANKLFIGSIDEVAIRLEQKHPMLKGRLIAAVEFSRQQHTHGSSTELIEATQQQAIREAETLDFRDALNFASLYRSGKLFAISTLGAILLIVLLPGIFTYSYEVYSNPTALIAPPLGYNIRSFPGNTEWVKYRDISFGAVLVGEKLPKKATIHHRLAGGSWQKTEVDLQSDLYSLDDGRDSARCAVTLRQINRSFDYYVIAGDLRTEVAKVNVVDKPRVSGIKLSLFYPDYTSLEPIVIDENSGSFSAIVGSRVHMELETNLPITNAELLYADSSRQPLTVSSRTAETSLHIEQSKSYHIELTNHLGETNPDPIEYYITAIPDEYPTIDVISPGFDVNLTDDMYLPVLLRIYDDFGFSSLVLKYSTVSHGQQSEEHVAVLHYSERIKTEGDVSFDWDLNPMNLYPGDYVLYYFEIADNDRISGPKISRTRQFIARIPSLDELIADIEGTTNEHLSNTEKLFQQGRELAERFENMSRKLRAKNKDAFKTDWQETQEMQTLAEKNQELIKNIEELAREMNKSVDKVADNAMMNRKIVEKMEQIQKLFEEVATPEMKAAQKKLMEALKKMDRNQIQKAMEDFQMSQEEMLKRLERTMALLKKMQLEQKMEALVRKAEELLKQQNELNQKTDESKKESLPSLSKSENDLKKSLKKLKSEVNELRKLMAEAKQKDNKSADKFAEAMEKTDADMNMQKMSDALSQQKKNQASKQGKKASKKLAEMLDEMQQQMMAMRGKNSGDNKRAMRMALADANTLSKDQEDLMEKAKSIGPRSAVLKDIATSEQNLASASTGLKNRIDELAMSSPFIGAELQMLIAQATEKMNMAVEGFYTGQTGQAQRLQRDAMSDLNKTAMRLMESMDKQSQCNKGGSCDKNTSKIESMCNKQNSLNQKTKKQCNKPSSNPGGMNQDSRNQLQRLASEQATIRKSMEELAKEFGQSRQILGRLEQIAEEMKKIEEDLQSGNVGDETTQRQLRVYSRMLQASRSLQRKDYSEQRKATSAETQLMAVPGNLPPELLDDRLDIEDRLQRFLGNNYPPQYEEQIKAYFRVLMQAEAKR